VWILREPREILEGLRELSRRAGAPLTKGRKKLKEHYTITGDVISYSLCPRQYALYRVFGFSPSNPSQEWYGSVAHRILKRLHGIYTRYGRLVEDREELYRLFLEVERSMEAEGVRASSEKVREVLVEVLYAFCRLFGKEFFESLVEAELRLVKELEHFILYGIVDAVKSQGESYEIWDYKAMRVPDPKEPEGRLKLERYSQQLFVYGYLFKERNGFYPKRAVLLFLNELLYSPKEKCLMVVDFSKKELQERAESFIEEFKRVVYEMEKSKESNQWALPQEPDPNTCRQCDFRWDCEKFKDLEEL